MCLLVTLFAAVAAAIAWRATAQKFQLGFLSLMYWGAALMWTVDGFFSLAAGEGFLELSAGDALLGLIVVLCGLAVWALRLLWSRRKKNVQSL